MPKGGSVRDVGFAGGGRGSVNGIAGLGMMGKGEGGGSSGARAFQHFFNRQGDLITPNSVAMERGGARRTPYGAKEDRFGNPILDANAQAKIAAAQKQAEHNRRMREDPVYKYEQEQLERDNRIAGYEDGVSSAFSMFNDDFFDTYGAQYGQTYKDGYAGEYANAQQSIRDRFAPLGGLGESHISDAFGDLENYYTTLTGDIGDNVESKVGSLRNTIDAAQKQYLASARQDKANAVTDAQARVAELKAPAAAPSVAGAFDSFFGKNPFLVGGAAAKTGTTPAKQAAGGSQNKGLVSLGSSGGSSSIVN